MKRSSNIEKNGKFGTNKEKENKSRKKSTSNKVWRTTPSISSERLIILLKNITINKLSRSANRYPIKSNQMFVAFA